MAGRPYPRITKPGHHHETRPAIRIYTTHLIYTTYLARPSVIPPKAGIHTPAITLHQPTGVLDSGLRRNDG